MNAAQPAIWKCLLTGGLAGFVNGFFGAGGGMIVVPLLILLVKLADKNAFSSAISIILPLTIVSLVIYAKNGALDLKAALPYLLAAQAAESSPGSGSRRSRRDFYTLRWGS